MSAPHSAPPSERRVLVGTMIAVVFLALGAWVGALSYAHFKENLPQDHVLEVYGLNRPIMNRLAAAFIDADGDLVADPPADPARRLKPDTVKFNYLATEQEHYAEIWTPFLAYLSARINRPVEYEPFDTPEDQLRAIKNGDVHIIGLNSGAVPIAVDACGFTPLVSFGSEKGLATYTMQIIVPAGNPIKEINQISGHMIALTESTSNSGWKAPMVALWREFHLQPVRDFDVVYSGDHAASIRGIASRKYEVAAVASDEVARAIARGEIAKDDFSVIYESEPFCNNTLGVPNILDPQLATTIKTAFLEYAWDGTDLSMEFSTIGADRFRAVDYKADFKLIREIDDAMGRRHEMPDLSARPAQPRS